MSKQNSALIASWRKEQDPLVDPPDVVTWADGSPATIENYNEHRSDTFSWDLDSADAPRRIIRPSLVANARYDPIAGAWVIGGHGVQRRVLGITDPNATEQEIAMEMSDWSTVYRLDGVPGKFCTSGSETNWYGRSMEWASRGSTRLSRL